jgi:guanylate kinase
MTAPGRLVVVSGPSGAGKTTLVAALLARCEVPLAMSVSATTRPPRHGERDGVEYFFLSQEEFAARREAGEFLECCEVFGRGVWYGTLRSEVTPRLAEGKWVLLEIDVQGAREVLRSYPDALTLFVSPGSVVELERRLRGRGTDSQEAIERRLEVARREMAAADQYQFRIVNDSVERAVDEICGILRKAEKVSR